MIEEQPAYDVVAQTQGVAWVMQVGFVVACFSIEPA
jgi:hypothetical protein